LDYTIHLLELRTVDFTAAAEDNFFLRAGDATAISKKSRSLQAVGATYARGEQALRCVDARLVAH
jgi:hypothetical protein